MRSAGAQNARARVSSAKWAARARSFRPIAREDCPRVSVNHVPYIVGLFDSAEKCYTGILPVQVTKGLCKAGTGTAAPVLPTPVFHRCRCGTEYKSASVVV